VSNSDLVAFLRISFDAGEAKAIALLLRYYHGHPTDFKDALD